MFGIRGRDPLGIHLLAGQPVAFPLQPRKLLLRPARPLLGLGQHLGGGLVAGIRLGRGLGGAMGGGLRLAHGVRRFGGLGTGRFGPLLVAGIGFGQ